MVRVADRRRSAEHGRSRLARGRRAVPVQPVSRSRSDPAAARLSVAAAIRPPGVARARQDGARLLPAHRRPVAARRDHRRAGQPRSRSASTRTLSPASATRCHVAMRYTPPFTDEARRRRRAAVQARTIVALSLYPHYTTATTGSSLWELRRELAGKAAGAGAVDLLEIDRWPDASRLSRRARRSRCAAGSSSSPSHRVLGVELLFSAHGLPEIVHQKGRSLRRAISSGPSPACSRASADSARGGCRSRAAPARRAGSSRRPTRCCGCWPRPAAPTCWWFPSRSSAITSRRSTRSICCSAARPSELGLNFKRAPSLNAEPRFIEALAQLVEERVAAAEADLGAVGSGST